MRLRIAFDARVIDDRFPGIGRYAYHLIDALARLGELRLSVLIDPRAADARFDIRALERGPGRIELRRVEAAPFSLAEQARVPGRARSMAGDVWHSPHYAMPYAGMPRPIVLTVHDLIPLVVPQHWTAIQRLAYRLMHRLALRTASHIITPSAATQRDLTRLFGAKPDRVSVVPEGVDARFRPASQDEIAAVRQKHGLPTDYLLYLGINKPPKNLVRLIEAWRAVCAATGDGQAKLAIAGHWEDRYPEAKQLAQNWGLLERVAFVGPVSEANLPALYSGASLFVLPSLYEGFGLPVLEAMACGAPVVCSQTGSLPEVVGGAARMFDPRDVDSIAKSIREALADGPLRDTLRRRGLRQAAAFTWDRTARETAQVYARVAQASRPGRSAR